MTDIEYRRALQRQMHGDESDITDDLNIQDPPSSRKRKTAPTPNPYAKRRGVPIITDTTNCQSRHQSQPSQDDDTKATLLLLVNLATKQTQALTAHFKKAESPEPKPPLLYQTPNYIPQDANGNNSFPTSPPMDLHQSLWPHIETTVIAMIIQSKLPIEKLHLLIPVDDRATPYERGELSISKDGMLMRTKRSGDIVMNVSALPQQRCPISPVALDFSRLANIECQP
jgi:hypothetical protein